MQSGKTALINFATAPEWDTVFTEAERLAKGLGRSLTRLDFTRVPVVHVGHVAAAAVAGARAVRAVDYTHSHSWRAGCFCTSAPCP